MRAIRTILFFILTASLIGCDGGADTMIGPRFGSPWLCPLQARYIARSGAVVEFPFLLAKPEFSEGLIPAIHPRDKGRSFGDGEVKIGVMNTHGKLVVPFMYDSIESFKYGVSIVVLEGRYGAIDRDGNPLLDLKYDRLSVAGPRSFIASVHQGSRGGKKLFRCGYLDRDGAALTELHYEECQAFEGGVGRAKRGGKWRLIDESGRSLNFSQFPRVGVFSEGLAVAARGGNATSVGYVDTAGNLVIPENFSEAKPFSEGLAAAKPNAEFAKKMGYEELFGYINSSGTYVIQPRFGDAWQFQGGSARVQDPRSQKFGFIREDGTFVAPPTYDFAEDFSDGLANVGVTVPNRGSNRRHGYINSSGELAIKMVFPYPGSFSDGFAKVDLCKTAVLPTAVK